MNLGKNEKTEKNTNSVNMIKIIEIRKIPKIQKKCIFPKYRKIGISKKNTLFFEIPKRGILGPPKKGVFWDPLKKGYFGKNRVFFEYGVY